MKQNHLEEYKRGLERKLDGFVKNLIILFHHTREQLDLLEKQSQSQICSYREMVIQAVSALIPKLYTRRSEMSKKMDEDEMSH